MTNQPNSGSETSANMNRFCEKCGISSVEPGYQTPLCANCRSSLVYRPVLSYIVMFCGIICVLMLISYARRGRRFRVYIANERASRAEASHDYATAEIQDKIVIKAYPFYDDGFVRLAKDSYAHGDYAETAYALDKLNGHELDSDTADDLNQIARDLDAKHHSFKRRVQQ